ncbi:MAG: TlpA family protein disulfide reductase [Flavobacteriaceae bacterium]
MKSLLFICILLLFFSCSNIEKPNHYKPTVSIDSLLSSKKNFLSYYFTSIDLSSPYTPINGEGKTVSKLTFLSAIETGDFFPVEVDYPTKAYQLIKLDSIQKKEYQKFLLAKAQQYKQYVQFLGNSFPDFELKDINGVTYNNKILKGKTVIVKFWFLNCKPCIEEIPALNTLANTYKDRDDVIFLSFALDGNKALQKFKANKEYYYETISAKDFIWKNLKIKVFPTHMIINKEGMVIFVDGKSTHIEETLKKELSK